MHLPEVESEYLACGAPEVRKLHWLRHGKLRCRTVQTDLLALFGYIQTGRSLDINQRLVKFPFSTEMDDLKTFQKFRKNIPHSLIDRSSPKTSANHKDDGLSEVKWQNFFAISRSPVKSSWRIGEPVRTALSAGRFFKVSGKLQQIFVADGIESLFASPGVMSDS